MLLSFIVGLSHVPENLNEYVGQISKTAENSEIIFLCYGADAAQTFEDAGRMLSGRENVRLTQCDELYAGRNSAVRAAKGSYVMFADIDDDIAFERYSELQALMLDNRYGLIMLEQTAETADKTVSECDNLSMLEFVLNGGDVSGCGNFAYRRSLIMREKITFLPDVFAEENFNLRFIGACKNGVRAGFVFNRTASARKSARFEYMAYESFVRNYETFKELLRTKGVYDTHMRGLQILTVRKLVKHMISACRENGNYEDVIGLYTSGPFCDEIMRGLKSTDFRKDRYCYFLLKYRKPVLFRFCVLFAKK